MTARRLPIAGIAATLMLPAGAAGQVVPPAPPVEPDETSGEDAATPPGGDIVITGQRIAGSAIGDIDPVATLDSAAIQALGAPDLKTLLDRLKPLTMSGSGGDPVYLLNGRRISAVNELYSLPQEAMEKIEVLPETEAARFGYPATVRVTNFITKKRFRGTTVQQVAGTTTEGGGATDYVEVNAARIDGPRRTTLSVSHLRLNPVFESDRGIRADADGPRGTAAVVDSGRYRTLQQRADTIRVDGTVAAPIGRTLSGSLNLAMEAQRNLGSNGLATALPAMPDGYDAVLRQRNASLNLHGAGMIQGSVRRWAWNVTGSYDRVRGVAQSDQDVLDLPEAAGAGGTPLASIDPADAATRIRYRSDTVTGTLLTKAVANGPLVRLPAGEAQLTLTGDYARSTSSGSLPGLADTSLDLARTTRGASINADVPIAAANQNALAFLGRLSLNGMLGVSDVSDYGRLVSSNYGVNWAPVRPLQITASVTRSQTPPAIALLTNPTVTTPNTPFFDFLGGTSVLVTTIAGGNPDVPPERRRVATIGVAVTPIKGRDLRVGVDYLETRIANQTATLGSATPAFQAAFPTAFERNAAGQLIGVDLRPFAVAREREKKLLVTINLSTPIGRAPPPLPQPPKPVAGETAAKDVPPAKPPKPRPQLFASISTTWRIDDRLTLRDGLPVLDLLDGATLSGTGGRPRWESELNLGLSIGPANLGIFARLQGPTRIRSELAASDLRFSGRVWLVPYAFVQVEPIVKRPWAKAMSLIFTVENLLDDRIAVRDRLGVTPNRFQGAYLDPLGRSVRLGVRKLF